MKHSIRFLAIAILFTINASAQTSGNHLLWRISGKGLSKPSYLFGTMHLTDKRLFYFGDSLYHALEQTDGFAAEIDFNAFLNKYFDKLIGERQQETYLKDELGEDVLAAHKSKLEKKFKKPVDKITLDDLKKEEGHRQTALLRSGEMETFMDAYLLGLADKQGKWTGGIEDPEDQLGLDDAFDTESRINSLLEDAAAEKSQLEWMVQTYLKENLELIDRSNDLWQGAKDVILIHRNLKMASRVDSLAQIRSCLFAVGAAHLPGDSGVVELLRDLGYEVTPVISSRKIDPAKYKYKQVKKEWVDVWGMDSLYTVKMPMRPSPIPSLAELPLDMVFYYDLPSNIAYFSACVPLSGTPSDLKDSIMANLTRHYKKEATYFEEKDIVRNGYKGKEFLIGSSEGEMRMQTFIPGNYITMMLVVGIKKESLYSESAARYFNSFRPDTARAAAAIANLETNGWQKLEYAADGFSVQAPSKFRRRKVDMGGNGWRRFVVEGSNPKTQAYYAITIDATDRGYYSNKDSVYFTETESSMLKATGAELVSSRPTTFDKYPAREMVMKVKKINSELQMRLLLISRGNKRYILYKAFDPKVEQSGVDDPFFQSFHFLPFPTGHWRKVKAKNDFTTYAPSEITGGDTTESGQITYLAYDSVSAVTFNVTKEILEGYYWTKDDSTLFGQKIDGFIGRGESLIQQKKIHDQRSVSAEALISLPGIDMVKKMKVVLVGDTLYTIYTFISPGMLDLPVYNKFFEEFRPVHQDGVTTVFGNRAKDLLNDLRSTDSATFEKASHSIMAAPFTVADLPLLQEALLYVYQDHDPADRFPGSTVVTTLARKIIQLDIAATSVSFIKNNYGILPKEKTYIRFVMLDILSMLHTDKSYDLLRQLLAAPLPQSEMYIYLRGLDDSLALSKRLFPDVFRAFNNKAMMRELSSLAVRLLDNNYLDLSVIRDHKKQLTDLTSKLLTLKGEELEEVSYEYVSMIELLARLRDSEANALLRKIAKSPALVINEAALMGLLKNGQQLSAADFLPLARADEYRSTLYEKLEEEKKISLFPSEFLTQRLLGQSQVFSNAYDDDRPTVTFIKEKTIDFSGEKKKVYLYKVTFGEEGEDEGYLGIAGPFSLDAKDLRSTHAVTGVYWDEPFDAKKIDSLLDTYLKQSAKEDEAAEE